MKNKSTRHKTENRFKFISFDERINNIDIDIFHRIGHENEWEKIENESKLYHCIKKWSKLNLSESFAVFKKDINVTNIVTLPQVILFKDDIIEVLVKHLNIKNQLSLQAVLEAVVAVADDLRRDFYPYYPQILTVLVKLLESRDAEQLELTFTCLSYIFKYCWRAFVSDIDKVLHSLFPLLKAGKPDYINNFAAESFAYVARKVRDKNSFVKLVLRNAEKSCEAVEGYAKILFETIKGVSGQFHSCAVEFLNALFQHFMSSAVSNTVIPDIFQYLTNLICEKIDSQHTHLFFNCIFARLKALCATDCKEDSTIKIIEILRLLGLAVEYHDGKALKHFADDFVQALRDALISSVCAQGEERLTLVKVCVSFLLAKQIKLKLDQSSALIQSVLDAADLETLLFFTERTSTYSMYEVQILPRFLAYLKTVQSPPPEYLTTLAKIVTFKMPPSQRGSDLEKWQKYELSAGLCSIKIVQPVCRIEQQTNFICALLCWPHIKDLSQLSDYDSYRDKLVHHLQTSCNALGTNDEPALSNNIQLIQLMVECLIHLDEREVLKHSLQFLFTKLLHIVQQQKDIFALRTIDMLLSYLRHDAEVMSYTNFQIVNTHIMDHLLSPVHEERLLAAHIYQLFEETTEFSTLEYPHDDNVTPEKFSLFTLIYEIEQIEPTVQTYREQLLRVDKLTFGRPQAQMCLQLTEVKTIPLRYLCGMLYMSFKLLWEPLSQAIASYAIEGSNITDFWCIFGYQLRRSADNIRNRNPAPESVLDNNVEASKNLLEKISKQQNLRHEKVNHHNYRLLLWKAMAMFPNIAEARNRYLTPLLLDFIRDEFSKTNSELSTSWNIRCNAAVIDCLDELQEDDSADEQDSKRVQPRNKTNDKENISTLLSKLSVFSKFKSPKTMYLESELHMLYLNLLEHRLEVIQKGALDCLLTYGHEFLVMYKEHLYNLIDDKKFKNELVVFKINEDSDMVKSEHRADLVPFVMRIVFSKMNAKTGGKAGGQHQRTLVFRFLSGCKSSEMTTFLRMTFRLFNCHIEGDEYTMACNVMKTVDLSKFWPPKRLQSCVNLLNVILKQLGGRMDSDGLVHLLRITSYIGALIGGALQQANDIYTGYIAPMRRLKNACLDILEQLFGRFSTFRWTGTQIDAIFEVFVWPSLYKLHTDSAHNPTSLLKLAHCWSQNPVLYCLFVKHAKEDREMFVLKKIVDLFASNKCHVSVLNIIIELFKNLLSLIEETKSDCNEPEADQANDLLLSDSTEYRLIEVVSDVLSIDEITSPKIKSLSTQINYGTLILSPYFTDILQYFVRKLQAKHAHLNANEVVILFRISELVWQPDLSQVVLSLIIPLLSKQKKAPSANTEDSRLEQLLGIVFNLMRNVSNVRKHMKLLGPLFVDVEQIQCRKILCSILQLCDDFNIIQELNAWDRRWVEQPDFDRRGAAFKTLEKMTKDNSIQLDVGILVIYNCFYILKHEKDLAQCENANHCLKTTCQSLVTRYASSYGPYLLDETIFEQIHLGLKSKSIEYRSQCISLLGHLSLKCADYHLVLRDLNRFTNEIDSEVDMFDNLVHLQSHRHSRAMLRFSQLTKDNQYTFQTKTLIKFMIPIVYFYLPSEKNNIQDASIECITTIASLLPWHNYESLLRFHLLRLRRNGDHQKQSVRLVVGILDAFHFDLSKSDLYTSVKAAQLPAQETEKVERKKELEEITDNKEDTSAAENVKLYSPKFIVLSKSTANVVIRTIQKTLLPQLMHNLAEKTNFENMHKLNRKVHSVEREEEDLLKVPLSLAVIKLLQRLPKTVLDANVPGIFMKMCTFLKSQLTSVRLLARETLQKMMISLGPDYVFMLFNEITPLMNRGFHLHVLVFTVHAILTVLKDKLKPDHIERVLVIVLDLCRAELFGWMAEEKEVAKIVSKTSEAKATKSFNTLQILAQYITKTCMVDIVLPIKEVLLDSKCFKVLDKTEQCFRHIAIGLVDNSFISTKELLQFSFGCASETIPQLFKKVETQPTKDANHVQKEDCFIIPKAPLHRSSYRLNAAKSTTNMNAHQITEFGMRLLMLLIKRERVSSDKFVPLLDPFMPIIQKCLKSEHVKLTTISLKCLAYLLRYDMPSFKTKSFKKKVISPIFEILHKYGAAGLDKSGNNFELVVSAFRTMAVVVKEVTDYTLDHDKMKILLLYVEQDIHNQDRRATAFNLLKVMLNRKMNAPELADVMEKVAELSITSESSEIRQQTRTVFHHYLLEYELGQKKIEEYVYFYLTQMGKYELPSGRESATEMIKTIILSFPMKTLFNYCGVLLGTLGIQLVKESPALRKSAYDCIKLMLSRMKKPRRNALFETTLLWLADKNKSTCRMAAQIVGLFAELEQAEFQDRLKKVIPTIARQFDLHDRAGRFVCVTIKNESDMSEEELKLRDMKLFHLLTMMGKIYFYCPGFIRMKMWAKFHCRLARHCQCLLSYPHDWVRTDAAKVINYICRPLDVDHLARLITEQTINADDAEPTADERYLHTDPINEIKTLTLSLIDQLYPMALGDLVVEAIKNLVFVARVLSKVCIPSETDAQRLDLRWLIRRMRKAVNLEVVHHANSVSVRDGVFTWIGAVGKVLQADQIIPVLTNLMFPIVRELTARQPDVSTDADDHTRKLSDIRGMAKLVANILKEKVGVEHYTDVLQKLEQNINIRKANRKRARKELAVTAPEIFAQKKIKLHKKKIEAKKRKINEYRKGDRVIVKRRKISPNAEEDF